jgi:heptosyltransferase-3
VRVLFLHPGALGDIILSLPAIALLRERLRPSEITVAGNLDYLRAVAEGYADNVRSLSSLPMPRLFGAGPLPAPDLSQWRTFDRIVSWMGAGDASFRANLGAAHGNVIIAGWKPGTGESRHVSQIFADSLAPWIGAASVVRPARLRPAPDARKGAPQWVQAEGGKGGEPIVALHPGAGSESKRWPLDRFAAATDWLASNSAMRVLIVEGPAEEGLGERLRDRFRSERVLLARPLELPALTAMLSRCSAFLGNDSGIAHLAAGLGLPCVVLFGPTAPGHWAPLGPTIQVLRSSSACDSCRSGSVSGHTCMEEISVESAIAALCGAAHVS